jgi:hypothetical protein
MRAKIAATVALLVGLAIGAEGAYQAVRLRLVIPGAAQGGGLNAGDVVLRVSGTCGTGFTEVSGMDGVFPVGTLDANGNVGGTGGNDNITPAGSNSVPTFTGSALGTHAHGAGTLVPNAHSGTAVQDHASHTHTYTDVVNHVHVQTNNSATTGGLLGWGAADTSTNNAQNTGYSTANPTGGVATGTTNGPSATLTHSVTQPSTHTMSGSSESVSGGTPAGTVTAPTFTGTQFDNRPAFKRVIFCQKD